LAFFEKDLRELVTLDHRVSFVASILGRPYPPLDTPNV
jgi:hypothetical protein